MLLALAIGNGGFRAAVLLKLQLKSLVKILRQLQPQPDLGIALLNKTFINGRLHAQGNLFSLKGD